MFNYYSFAHLHKGVVVRCFLLIFLKTIKMYKSMIKKYFFKVPYEVIVAAASCKILFGDNYFYLLPIIAATVLLYRLGSEK